MGSYLGGTTFEEMNKLTTGELWGVVIGATIVDSDWTVYITKNVLKSRGEFEGMNVTYEAPPTPRSLLH